MEAEAERSRSGTTPEKDCETPRPQPMKVMRRRRKEMDCAQKKGRPKSCASQSSRLPKGVVPTVLEQIAEPRLIKTNHEPESFSIIVNKVTKVQDCLVRVPDSE